ncbi:MAG TPA: chitobiase/beta-hexosaminidase C-terminal domain-containing protein [Spirochaetia bacterium]|nr:chitobiase/beta-hexosaminidase C-terminal domain-containing protein [Spirochaetales bacterium]HRY79669.1 chitobiase/beta-hexosaminidase C-terminal domain-containing protein [Spirochaetia bacterium]HRZ89519.1 chitobiase/beta-hexosaminidase C-terminal domain-containing protein [Spirochaetia bacterium]
MRFRNFAVLAFLAAAGMLAGCAAAGAGGEDPTLEQVAAPTFTPSPGTFSEDQSVEISSATGGAEIRYTTDGSAPGGSSTLYTVPIAIAGNGTTMTIRAFARMSGMSDSDAADATYTIDYSQVSTPQFSPAPGAVDPGTVVTFSCATSGVTYHCTTDGTDPTTGSPSVSSYQVDGPVTLKLLAVKAGMADSPVAVATYAPRLPAPGLSPAAGTVEGGSTVSFSSPVAGVTYHYTTNGTTPTTGSPSATGIQVNDPVTLKVIAVKAGWTSSGVATAAYTPKVAAPTLAPGSGIVSHAAAVTFGCATSGVTYRYTVDGSDPTGTSASGGSYSVDMSPVTVKVMATRPGWANSDIASQTYTVNPPAAPTGFSVNLAARGWDSAGWRYDIDPAAWSHSGINLGWFDIEVFVDGAWRYVVGATGIPGSRQANISFAQYYPSGKTGTVVWIPESLGEYAFRITARNAGGTSAPATTTARTEIGTPALQLYSYTMAAPWQSTVRIYQLSDGGVHGYKAERYNPDTGLWSEVGSALIGAKSWNVSQWVLDHTDTRPDNTKAYKYRVRGYRDIGGGVLQYSAYSNEVSCR